MSKRVLQIVTGLSGGGVGSVIMNYYSHMDDQFVFDFVVNKKSNGFLEKEIERRGGIIYEVPPLQYGKRAYFSQLIKVIKNNKESILHCNMGEKSFFFLFFGALFGVKRRILHIHSSVRPEGKKERMLRIILSKLCFLFATDYFSCGEEAAKWFYGKKRGVVILKNAIELHNYKFSSDKRNEIRQRLQLDDKFVIGNVGRLSPPKNHLFMLDVFNEVHKINNNAILLLVGNGELQSKIEKKVEEYGLKKNVILLGLADNVNELLNAFDVFLMPSISEGVPVAAIEAMANGLKVICSQSVTKEISVENRIKYLSLDDDIQDWVNCLLSTDVTRCDVEKQLVVKGFSIIEEAIHLTNLYLKK